MPIRFQETPTANFLCPYTGFDGYSNPKLPWLMVPEGGMNDVLLKGGVQAGRQADITPKDRNAGAVVQTKQPQGKDLRLTFKGSSTGTFLFTAQLGTEKKELEVTVVPELTKSVSFYVMDGTGTARGKRDAEAGLKGLEAIYKPQANVVFTNAFAVATAPIGTATWEGTPNAPLDVKGKDAKQLGIWYETSWSGDIRVFFAREIQLAEPGADTDGFSPTIKGNPAASNNIFIEDLLSKLNTTGFGDTFQRALAHEVLHVFRRDGHDSDLTDKEYLLYGYTDGNTRLRKEDVFKIHGLSL